MAFAYGWMIWRATDRARQVSRIAFLALGGLIAEHTCIEWYHFYSYSDGWWLRVGHVPLMVPLIWPMVILSAGQIANTLWPSPSRTRTAVIVGSIVVFDASLMEVASVGAGYWTWFEPGYLDVPIMGVVGWGCFAFIAWWWMARVASTGARAASVFFGLPLVLTACHGLLLAFWWGAFRWGLRGDLGDIAVAGFAVLSLIYVAAVLRVRRSRALGPDTVPPRVAATSVFLALLAVLAQPLLWAHLALTALPYLAATRLRTKRG